MNPTNGAPRKFILLAIVCTLLLNLPSIGQSDSVHFWRNALSNASNYDKAVQVEENIQRYFERNKSKRIIQDAEIILTAAANSEYAQRVFFELFYCFDNRARENNEEIAFIKLALNFELHKEFKNENVLHQLYYYYAVTFFNMSEYYQAEKYLDVFLKYKERAFPEKVQDNFYLNAMTITALIDLKQNKLTESLKKLNEVLDSSISKKNAAWIGITKGNIGDIYSRQGKLEEALSYLKEDSRTSMEHKELLSAMQSFITINEIYNQLHQPTVAEKYLDSAYQLYQRIQVESPQDKLVLLASGRDIFNSLGNVYYNKKDFRKASEFFKSESDINQLISQNRIAEQQKKAIQGIEIDRILTQIGELHAEIKSKEDHLLISITIIIAVIILLIIYIIFNKNLKNSYKKVLEKNSVIEQQKQELENTNSDKDLLISIISHDVRSPAATLHQILKSFYDKLLPISAFEELLPKIIVHSGNLVNILESLLTWSVTQVKGIEIRKEKIAIKELISANFHFFEEQANRKSITLIDQCDAQTVWMDRNHLEIILRNLTSNAIKFSKIGSSILFQLIENTDSFELSVTDKGIGMTEAQIQLIMNARAVKSNFGTTGEKGIGLGLMIAKKFIDANGGKISIKSEPNIGTSISFTIPK